MQSKIFDCKYSNRWQVTIQSILQGCGRWALQLMQVNSRGLDVLIFWFILVIEQLNVRILFFMEPLIRIIFAQTFTKKVGKKFCYGFCFGNSFWKVCGQQNFIGRKFFVIIILQLFLQFYQSSTMESQRKKLTNNNIQVPEILPKQPNGNSLYFGKQPPCLTNYYIQLFSVFHQLTTELFKNADLISQFVQKPPEQMPESKKSTNSTQSQSDKSRKNDSEQNMNQNQEQQMINRKKELRRRRKIKESQEQSYVPQAEEYDGSYWAISQSKNMPKNFRKALFNFITKQGPYVGSVLERLKIDPQEFNKSVSLYGAKINSIAELRAFWSDSDNKFAKAYRIISMQYLRKHSLGYIFNSKVNKFQKHIKYRQIIMQGVKNPENFTCMKQF